ncbi:MAG: hypothetical protein ACW964_11290 [Candidatus Hodarchaeales archaeon]|jgi:hypothetical protein
MVIEKISCPHCGNLTEVGTPSGTEITAVKSKSFWNIFVDSQYGSRMITKCEHCDGTIAIWFRKKKEKD